MRRFVRRERAIALVLFVLGGCPNPNTRSSTNVDTKASSDGSTLVLYSDGAYMRYRTKARFESGVGRLTNVPLGQRTSARVVGGGPLSVEYELPLARRDEWSRLIKDTQVVAITDDRRVEGTVVSWDYRGLHVRTDSGLATITEPLVALKLPEPPGALISGALDLRGADVDEGVVEVETWLVGLSWRVAYTIILAGLDADVANIQGWLAVDSRLAEPIRVAQISVVDGRATLPKPDGSIRFSPPPQQPSNLASRVSVVELGRGGEIRAGGSARLPLFEGARQVPVAVRRVFDPVGDSLSHQGATPITRRSYGTKRQRDVLPVSLSITLELSEAKLRSLPSGEVSLFARTRQGIRALGTTSGFGRPPPKQTLGDEQGPTGSADGEAAIRLGRGELRIGVAPGLTGRRWQESVDVDKDRKRVVEEIRVELTNKTDEAGEVTVHEHLYRGLNWSLAYHNGAGKPTKVGPQIVHFVVNVPAKEKVLLMYRVVYTW